MARPRKPWYRQRCNDWCVTIDGKQVPLGKHPADAGSPRRGKPKSGQAAGDWVMPPAIEREFHRIMSGRDEPGGNAPAGSVVTLLGKFLGWTKKHKSPATYDQRRHFLKSFVKHRGVRTLPPHRVTVELVEGWLEAHPKWKASRRHAILCLMRAFNWGVKRGRIGKNPIVGIEIPPQRRVLTYLTAEQRKEVFEVTKDRAFRQFLTALQETGCRPGEISAVEAKHVNLDAGVWVLPKHKTSGKTGKPRTVFLTDVMLDLTRTLMLKNPTGPLFLNYRSGPWNINSVRCRFRKLRKLFPNFGHFTATSFRRAYVTDALERGVELAKVAELVGHTSTDMVMRHYNQLQARTAHMREMANKATA